MSILSSEIKLYKSQTVSDTSANGGRRSTSEIVSNTLGNCFDHVLPDERTAGSQKQRKCFYKIANDDDLTLYSAKLFLDAPTAGDDWVTMFAGEPRDTMADHGSDRLYGVAFLAADVSAGASVVVVEVEDASIAGEIFADGDGVVITDKLTPGATAGNRELHTISGVPVVVDTQVTITLAGVLANDYAVAGNARVASVIDTGDVACTVDNWVETGDGTYDETTYPVVSDNLGTIEQSWTMEFLDATTFTCVGDVIGSVGSGSTGTNFAPVNPVNAKPYFTLDANGHGGTHSAGDTIEFDTHGAEVPFYLDRTVPAGASTVSGNRITPVLLGATA
jgi:hypothetical protein